MKLLIVSHPCLFSTHQQFYTEVEQQTGWELTIVTPASWESEYGGAVFSKRWAGYQGQLLSIPIFNSGNIPLHAYRSIFVPLLKEVDPDVIYVHHEPYAVATAQVYFANYLTIRCPIGFYSAQNIQKAYPLPFRQTENFIFNNSKFALPISSSVEQVLLSKGCKARSTVVAQGIDPNIYYPHKQAKELAEKWRSSQEEIVLGYLGRIVEEKGLRTLLYSLKQIEHLPWKLVAIGSGAFESQFDALVHDLGLTGRVIRLGYVPHAEAPLYLSAFDILVLPSETQPNWKEQFGRVIIEALACGVPIVGSDSGEIPHLIKATGGGVIFQERNVDSLAQELQTLILNSSLRQHLAAKGRQTVLESYTNTAIVQKFVETIENVI